MMKQKKSTFQKICLLTGIFLLTMAAVFMLLWQKKMDISLQQTADCVETLKALMPEPQRAVPEERKENAMPVLSIEGTDFLGILEIPSYGSQLPVCAEWGRRSGYPSRFSGSVYDRTIEIGGMSQKGQYDFYREISVGDEVFFTDMTGNQYAYAVKDIVYRKHADQTALKSKEADLTLFIKNMYAFEYVLVFCEGIG